MIQKSRPMAIDRIEPPLILDLTLIDINEKLLEKSFLHALRLLFLAFHLAQASHFERSF